MIAMYFVSNLYTSNFDLKISSADIDKLIIDDLDEIARTITHIVFDLYQTTVCWICVMI